MWWSRVGHAVEVRKQEETIMVEGTAGRQAGLMQEQKL